MSAHRTSNGVVQFASKTNTRMSSGREREGLSYKNFAEAKLAKSQIERETRNAMENEFAAFVAIDWADQKQPG